ncbi:MAG: diguanylate cyclase (GGDEF)-like protein/PAS domain S-box-containing protein [Flavobacteriales bacterium]|jgi:diguanylate cyclase (GGDEF)-like protein/PAS domain S-box-containing protein
MTNLRQSWNSLHAKLLRNIAASLSVAIVLSGIVLLIAVNNFIKARTASELGVIGNILSEKTAFQLGLGDYYRNEAEILLSSARHHADIELACLYTADGSIFAEYKETNSTKICKVNTSLVSFKLIKQELLSTEVIFPIHQNGEQLGQLNISSSGKELNRALTVFFITVLATLGVAVLIAFFIGRNLVNRSLVPLTALSETSKKIAENPFLQVRAEKMGDDEVGKLVDVFNSMLDALSLENKLLKSSESTFRSLAENAPVGIFLRKSSTDFEYVNGTWRKLTGLDLTKSSDFVSLVADDHKDNYQRKISRLAEQQHSAVVEFEFLTPAREKRFFMEYVSHIQDSDGSSYVGSLLDVTDLKRAQVELESLAYYDPLTKLPNRRFLKDHLNFALAKARKDNTKMAVLMTDLDDFKKINDSLGHDAGDKLLAKLATRLRDAVFEEDVVSRMGGDEFLILVENIENTSCLEFISKRLLGAMRTQAVHEENIIPVSGSIGIAVFPDDAQNSDELLRFADMALYSSKARGGDNFSFYSEELDRNIRQQIHIEQKLRIALDEDALELFIQPQFNSGKHTMCWAEALIRWFDKDDGAISPAMFIPIAENSGLIHRVGDFVIERVCQILAKNGTALKQLGMQGISINLSARQFFSHDLINKIKNTLEKYNVPAGRLGIEITETMVMDDVEMAISIMNELKSMGCIISMDDFGTGYSSLTYLKRFPIDHLKIDQSFIRDIPEDKDDMEIACAIIDLAHNLGMTVVAEGVETIQQATFLAKNNCEFLQGYYLCRPISVQEVLVKHSANKRHNIQAPDSASASASASASNKR